MEHHQEISIAFPPFSLKGFGLAFEVYQEEKKRKGKKKAGFKIEYLILRFQVFQDKILVWWGPLIRNTTGLWSETPSSSFFFLLFIFHHIYLLETVGFLFLNFRAK